MATGTISNAEMEEMLDAKSKHFTDFLEGEPPKVRGEELLALWDLVDDENVQKTIVKTVTGHSNDEENPVFPYEKLQAVLKGAENWKWPRMWQRLDELERRGEAFREEEVLNFNLPNKNPNITSRSVLIVGGGPIGIRTAIELVMGGHMVTVVEKRRELRHADGSLKATGFTNRINRPHMWHFVRNDLVRLNGKDFLSQKAAYPVFTEPDTSSIGIDELQLLLLKNALLLGVDFRLGVGFDDARIKTEEDTMMPYWECDMTYDEEAAAKHGKTAGKTTMEFDCIVGCDGPRSTVRSKLQKHFGNIEKRKFMDCVGVVTNVQKVPRNRLKELGFSQEPGDMNRGKMVFKEFFAKLQDEADADIESLIYYKASYHNYTIIVPKRQDMVKHGLSGKVMSFHDGRSNAANPAMEEEKTKLKAYVKRILKVAGIPIDEEAEYGGFVGPPNDCMAFDFAECWNTKKSMAFSYPPPNYSVAEDGEWDGKRLVPLVALAGDSLLEPFWPLGLGLKRGWQAVMDTAFAIDNIFNRTFFTELKGGDPETWDWDEHYEALTEQCDSHFEYCNRMLVAKELSAGDYADGGQVMNQLKKLDKDAEKPMLEVEIDPWLRYEPLEKQRGDKWKDLPKEEQKKFQHPAVTKALARKEFYAKQIKGKDGVVAYVGKDLVSINGRIPRSAVPKTDKPK